MQLGFLFLFNSIMLGVGLAMDAFSVSLANGLNEPHMRKFKMCGIAGVFAFFQALMPMIGWICIHTIVERFRLFEGFIPWIALLLLGYIGGKMIIESLKGKDDDLSVKRLSIPTLLFQGVATSIDALSVGFTIADYNFWLALTAAVIIAVVTFIICFGGLIIGRKAGTKLAGKSGILGGAILIFIGVEIFISNMI